MADKKANHYGTTSNDTSHRKTWDREKYAAQARERDAKARDEAAARREAEQQGKTYRRRASTPPDVRDAESRTARIDFNSQVGKTTLVAASAAIGKKGRGAGFYCDACDLTFKDNKQLVEHYNSIQHRRQTGQSLEVTRATLEDVRARLAWLKRKKDESEKAATQNLEERLQDRHNHDEWEREERRRKRREKRQRKKNDNAEGSTQMRWNEGDDGVIR